MAAVNDVSNAERHKQWYDDDVTEINPEIRQLLESYSKIPSAEVVKHVNEIVSSRPPFTITLRPYSTR